MKEADTDACGELMKYFSDEFTTTQPSSNHQWLYVLQEDMQYLTSNENHNNKQTMTAKICRHSPSQ